MHQRNDGVRLARDSAGKLEMEAILETKAETILQFIRGLRGSLHMTWEEGTWKRRQSVKPVRCSET
jgi:hypothetical protein